MWVSTTAALVGPIIVFLATAIVVATSEKLRYLVIGVPAIAFYTTYYLTFSLVFAEVSGLNFDNVPNIWLFIWSVGATMLLAAYWLPKSSASLSSSS